MLKFKSLSDCFEFFKLSFAEESSADHCAFETYDVRVAVFEGFFYEDRTVIIVYPGDIFVISPDGVVDMLEIEGTADGLSDKIKEILSYSIQRGWMPRELLRSISDYRSGGPNKTPFDELCKDIIERAEIRLNLLH